MRTYSVPVCEFHADLPEGAGNVTALNLRFKILDLDGICGGHPCVRRVAKPATGVS